MRRLSLAFGAIIVMVLTIMAIDIGPPLFTNDMVISEMVIQQLDSVHATAPGDVIQTFDNNAQILTKAGYGHASQEVASQQRYIRSDILEDMYFEDIGDFHSSETASTRGDPIDDNGRRA